MKVYDADGVIAGRLAAQIVKDLKKNEDVVVVNVEKAVISGPLTRTVKVYADKRNMTNKSNPEHAKKFPRRPDFFFKKIVSGMLPKTSRRDDLLKKLKAYVGVPKEYEGQGKNELKKKEALRIRHASILEITQKLGFKAY
ncbi:50S ribosomal protein L13 [Candidatus Micrarchaeota archaeon]|nr:50S ribosomal protein L13 [Candidatus Micrarchaeota archaeon]